MRSFDYVQLGPTRLRPNGNFLKEPLHCLADCEAEMGFSWERHTFGGDIWAIDHPGHFVAYYGLKRRLDFQRTVKRRVVIPHWWVHVWFRQSTWDHFQELYVTHQLWLPDETGSGFYFQADSLWNSSCYTLYRAGVRLQSCIMSENPPFILWRMVKPYHDFRHFVFVHGYPPRGTIHERKTPPRDGNTATGPISVSSGIDEERFRSYVSIVRMMTASLGCSRGSVTYADDGQMLYIDLHAFTFVSTR
ncbi:hypothetical protein J1614_004198 [Plenodomus biglobosus]|nr:hypothetical protein J1614_004198 [Plenodomus biglobosus]